MRAPEPHRARDRAGVRVMVGKGATKGTYPGTGNPRRLLRRLGVLPVKLVVFACLCLSGPRFSIDEGVPSPRRAVNELPCNPRPCGDGEVNVRVARLIEYVDVVRRSSGVECG